MGLCTSWISCLPKYFRVDLWKALRLPKMDIDLTQVTGITMKHLAMSMLIVMKRVSQVHSKIERLLYPQNVVTASQSSQRKHKSRLLPDQNLSPKYNYLTLLPWRPYQGLLSQCRKLDIVIQRVRSIKFHRIEHFVCINLLDQFRQEEEGILLLEEV